MAIANLVLPQASGGTAPYAYTLTPTTLPTGLSYNVATRTLSGIPTAVFSQAEFTYTVTDAATPALTSTLTFNITVTEPSQTGLTLSPSTVSDQSYTRGVAIANLVLPEASGGTAPYTYTLTPTTLPSGLSFNGSTRTLSGTPTAVFSQAEFTYTATDAATPALTSTLTFDITVTDPPQAGLTFSSGPVPDQTYIQGVIISDLTLPEAQGGVAPYTYTVNPTLPSGLNFNAVTRIISGTPTASSVSSVFTYTAEDADGTTVTQTFNIEVVLPADLTFADMVGAQTYPVKLAIADLILPEAMGGIAPYAYSLSPDLPSGLSFDGDTRTLSGTPLEVMTSTNYTYVAEDNSGIRIQQSFSISVYGISFIETIQNQTYPRDEPIVTLTLPEVSGGVNPVEYTLNLLSLPSDLQYDAFTRIISGVPRVITPPVDLIYKATDANGAQDSLAFTVEVISPVSTESIDGMPQKFIVHTNYPNPFLRSTTLVFDLPWSAQVQVEVMDITGRRVHNQTPVIMTAGWRQEIALDDLTLPSGSYLYRMVVTSIENHRTATHSAHFVSIQSRLRRFQIFEILNPLFI